MFTIENFINNLKIITKKYDITTNNDTIMLTPNVDMMNVEEAFLGEDRIRFAFDLSQIETLLLELQQSECSEYEILTEREYEVQVVRSRNNGLYYRHIERYSYPTVGKHYGLRIVKASLRYIVYCICCHAEEIRTHSPSRHSISEENTNDFNSFADLFEITTINVVFQNKPSLQVLQKLVQSYLFNIAYVNNVYLDVISSESINTRGLTTYRSRIGQLYPYKEYIPELLSYYKQGLSTTSPMAKFLAFYHIVEFFFISIVEDDVLNELKNSITRPSFSPHSKIKLRELYKSIRTRILSQKNEGLWDERKGLLLCIEKFIPDINQFRMSVNSIDATSIDYYKNNQVSFASGSCLIDFDADSETLMKCIRDRIYATRNAIVHSKEGDKLKYIPFKHDLELEKEIPLIKALAEEVIINSAKNTGIE